LVNPFSYTPSIIQALETALSTERLTAYLRVTGGDRERALRLYLWNSEISAAFYAPLQGQPFQYGHLCAISLAVETCCPF